MNLRSISLDSQRHITRFRHLPPGPSSPPAADLHQRSNRQYLDRLIDIFRQSELPGKEHHEQYLLKLCRKTAGLLPDGLKANAAFLRHK